MSVSPVVELRFMKDPDSDYTLDVHLTSTYMCIRINMDTHIYTSHTHNKKLFNLKINFYTGQWWHTLLISALGVRGRWILEFKASLVYSLV